MNIPILMYHSVSDINDQMSVKIDNFEKQMDLMSRLGFKSYNLKDLSLIKNNKSFIITFDDGYEDTYINAMPIIKKYNFKATCFFVTSEIGKFNAWDIGNHQYIKKKLMDEKQLSEWQNNGFEVGSHTHEHKNLNNLNYEEQLFQINYPKKIFKDKFNINIKSFSYPFGSYNDTSMKIVKDNYKYGVTTKRSRYKHNKFNDNEIPRVPVSSQDGIFKFFLKIKTFYEDVKYKK